MLILSIEQTNMLTKENYIESMYTKMAIHLGFILIKNSHH
jgi:hypothetical protein